MQENIVFTKDTLLNLKPEHPVFIGVDSDGCVFDTMAVKQKQCFHPLIISHWQLEPIAEYVRETAEFVNLYSAFRGQNRFISLLKTMDMLRARPEVTGSGVKIPKLETLRNFITSGAALSNEELQKKAAEENSAELESVLEWSHMVNGLISEKAAATPPFEWARKSLEKTSARADVICVSQTPSQALVREWRENSMLGYVRGIAGQETGSKTEHIRMATSGKYAPGKTMMIGDAPGDRKAAENNNTLFYPINPGHEEESWQRFHDATLNLFLNGKFDAEYQEQLNKQFNALLPKTPPWQNDNTTKELK